MAKQTFTTGSVLTATQMNNLQANDYNWTVSQKTASYVLVAADAGTRIEMNAAGATTVTVNTGLFSAGDTLFIQNIGAGSCVITAGTATVQKSANASLTLSQYQGGYLYFISTSNAVFFADAGFTSPLTTKGDLFTWDTGNARLGVGSNDQVLTADSAQATGLKWAAAGGMTLLSTTTPTASATTVNITGISTSYKHLFIVGLGLRSNAGAVNNGINMRFNNDSGTAKYVYVGSPSTSMANAWYFYGNSAESANTMWVYNYAQTSYVKPTKGTGVSGSASGGTISGQEGWGYYNSTSAINEVNLIAASSSFQATGVIYVYGVN